MLGFFGMTLEEELKGEAGRSEVVVSQILLMLLDSLFPVVVGHWVWFGTEAVILASLPHFDCFLLQ